MNNEAVSSAQRVSRETMWVHSLHHLRDEVSEPLRPMVEDGISFMEANVVAAEPIVSEDGEQYGIRHFGTHSIGFAALFHSDGSLHEWFKKRIDNPEYSYQEELRSIIVAPQRMSNRWRGILLFHELLHARYHKESRFRDVDNAHYVEEQSVYRDEHRIIANLYGDKYSAAVTDGSQWVVERSVDGFVERQAIASVANYILDTIVDDPSYRSEENFRRGAVMQHVGFEALRHVGLDSDANRGKFTRSLEKDRAPIVWLGSQL